MEPHTAQSVRLQPAGFEDPEVSLGQPLQAWRECVASQANAGRFGSLVDSQSLVAPGWMGQDAI